MNENHGRNEDRRRDEISSDDLFDVLSDEKRRAVLFHLRQHGAATVDELVDVLVGIGEGNFTESGREHVFISLYHVHLPKLAGQGLISYDPDDQIVEFTATSDDVDEWLDLAVRRDIAIERLSETRGRKDDLETIRVLLTDDEPGLPETVAAYVEREYDEMEITTATSTSEAVNHLEEESFDCIVSDYKMPGISGLDFLKTVRESDGTIPFILFTAKGSEEVASQAITNGVSDYVTKSTDTAQFDELADRIRKAVGQNGDTD
ncbi:response regulator [Natrinema halophilum]|uniref:Response regulator n=1 Tax=Natrinema halophilum TaxID=1699371 RepID=A0A7D5GQ10_9EURY|nr:response regulator [Natrinema halophilum]QLG47389.1 response regulator [Natrinema halophilum]